MVRFERLVNLRKRSKQSRRESSCRHPKLRLGGSSTASMKLGGSDDASYALLSNSGPESDIFDNESYSAIVSVPSLPPLLSHGISWSPHGHDQRMNQLPSSTADAKSCNENSVARKNEIRKPLKLKNLFMHATRKSPSLQIGSASSEVWPFVAMGAASRMSGTENKKKNEKFSEQHKKSVEKWKQQENRRRLRRRFMFRRCSTAPLDRSTDTSVNSDIGLNKVSYSSVKRVSPWSKEGFMVAAKTYANQDRRFANHQKNLDSTTSAINQDTTDVSTDQAKHLDSSSTNGTTGNSICQMQCISTDLISATWEAFLTESVEFIDDHSLLLCGTKFEILTSLLHREQGIVSKPSVLENSNLIEAPPEKEENQMTFVDTVDKLLEKDEVETLEETKKDLSASSKNRRSFMPVFPNHMRKTHVESKEETKEQSQEESFTALATSRSLRSPLRVHACIEETKLDPCEESKEELMKETVTCKPLRGKAQSPLEVSKDALFDEVVRKTVVETLRAILKANVHQTPIEELHAPFDEVDDVEEFCPQSKNKPEQTLWSSFHSNNNATTVDQTQVTGADTVDKAGMSHGAQVDWEAATVKTVTETKEATKLENKDTETKEAEAKNDETKGTDSTGFLSCAPTPCLEDMFQLSDGKQGMPIETWSFDDTIFQFEDSTVGTSDPW